jgi:methionine aminopeptidase
VTPAGRAGAWPVRTADGSLTAHFEHTIIVGTERGEILTAPAAA